MIIKNVKDTMYEAQIKLIVGCTRKELETYLTKKYHMGVTANWNCDACYFCIQGMNFIWLEYFDWSIPAHGLLHHEIFHCSTDVLLDMGFKLSDDSQEAFAYYHQHLTVNFLGVLSKISVEDMKLKVSK